MNQTRIAAHRRLEECRPLATDERIKHAQQLLDELNDAAAMVEFQIVELLRVCPESGKPPPTAWMGDSRGPCQGCARSAMAVKGKVVKHTRSIT